MCHGAEAAKQILRDTEQAEKIHGAQWRPASIAGAHASVKGSGTDTYFFFPKAHFLYLVCDLVKFRKRVEELKV